MIGRVIGGVLLGALAVAVVYEILDRENPELIEKVKSWFSTEDEFDEPEDELAD